MHFKLIFVEGDCDLAFVTTLFDLKSIDFLKITEKISEDKNGKLIKEIIERHFSSLQKRKKIVSLKDDTIYYIFTFSQAESYRVLMTQTLNTLLTTFIKIRKQLLEMVDIIVIADCDAETIQQCHNRIKICTSKDLESPEGCKIFYIKCYMKNNHLVHLLLIVPSMEKLLNYKYVKGRSKKNMCQELTDINRGYLYEIYEKCVNNNLI